MGRPLGDAELVTIRLVARLKRSAVVVAGVAAPPAPAPPPPPLKLARARFMVEGGDDDEDLGWVVVGFEEIGT